MHGEAVPFGEAGERLELIDRVDGAPFGGLGEREYARFRVVDVSALKDYALDLGGGEFALGAGGDEDLGAVGEKLRRAAFIGLDVRVVVADDAVIALAERGEGEGVGGGAVEDEEDVAVGLEHTAEQVAGAHGPFVVAVGREAAAVGLGQGGPGLRADAGGVVTGEDLVGGGRAVAIGRR